MVCTIVVDVWISLPEFKPNTCWLLSGTYYTLIKGRVEALTYHILCLLCDQDEESREHLYFCLQFARDMRFWSFIKPC